MPELFSDLLKVQKTVKTPVEEISMHERVNPGPVEPRNIWAPQTKLLCIVVLGFAAKKRLDQSLKLPSD